MSPGLTLSNRGNRGGSLGLRLSLAGSAFVVPSSQPSFFDFTTNLNPDITVLFLFRVRGFLELMSA